MHRGFPFKSLGELLECARAMDAALPHIEDTRVLGAPLKTGGAEIPNRLCVQPMEGCDSDAAGAPTALTFRRYGRFARGGAGLVWLEAVAVCEAGRANARQLFINRDTLNAFKRLRLHIEEEAAKAGRAKPFTVVQLTHSGRYARPNPRCAYGDGDIIGDEEIGQAVDAFAEAATLCREAGFGAVDIKACHRYLFSELLGAHERAGAFGGGFEGRARAVLESVEGAVKAAGRDYTYASRINVYDGAAGPFGNDGFEEPARLIRALGERGVALFNITAGTPYVNPHVNRPYASGGYEPPEHPLKGVARLLECCKQAKAVLPGAAFVATGFSYLRHYAPGVAAAMVEGGACDMAGFGRQSFAYPDFAADILEGGGMAAEKGCLTCGLCTALMRAGGVTGCPVRDREPYYELLKAAQREGRA